MMLSHRSSLISAIHFLIFIVVIILLLQVFILLFLVSLIALLVESNDPFLIVTHDVIVPLVLEFSHANFLFLHLSRSLKFLCRLP